MCDGKKDDRSNTNILRNEDIDMVLLAITMCMVCYIKCNETNGGVLTSSLYAELILLKGH